MQVLILLLLFVAPHQARGQGYHCQDSKDCQQNAVCETGSCICKAGFTNTNQTCRQCPGEDERCENCCFPPETLVCYQDVQNYKTCNGHFNHSFIMAAQVALGAALAIAFVALIALFWKTCPRGNSRGLSSLLREQENSLTSLQRHVLRRLRDRPPRYDDNDQIQLEKPPAYEEVANITNIQVPALSPPRYSANKQDEESKESTNSQEQKNSASQSTSSSSGVVNPAFAITDQGTETSCKQCEQHEENKMPLSASNISGRINLVLAVPVTNEATQTDQYI